MRGFKVLEPKKKYQKKLKLMDEKRFELLAFRTHINMRNENHTPRPHALERILNFFSL
jgi:hypothetical protein